MKHPTKKQMQKVIDSLRSIEESANKEGRFNISEPSVRFLGGVGRLGYHCATVHCVAGWYAMANLDKFEPNTTLDFIDGANLMAQDLGFIDDRDLEHWAERNRRIWGNEEGEEMFCDVGAYNGLYEDSENPMTIIIEHFEGVRDRLPK